MIFPFGLLLLRGLAVPIDISSFYPTTGGHPSATITTANGNYAQVTPLSQNVVYYGTTRSQVYVNVDGTISFNRYLTTFQSTPLPGYDPPKICPFWGDLNISTSTTAFYPDGPTAAYTAMYTVYNTTGAVLTRATNDVRSRSGYFPGFDQFNANWVLIVTWQGLPYSTQLPLPSASNWWSSTQTFQAVLIQGVAGTTNATFCAFIYPPNGIHYFPGVAGTNANVGFDAGDLNRYYILPQSRTATLPTLSNNSYFFRVDQSSISAGAPLPPVIYNIAPAALPTLETVPATITIVGYNFVTFGNPTPVVSIGGANCPVTSFDAGTIKCLLPSGQGLASVGLTLGSSSSLPLPTWATDMVFYPSAQTTSGCVALGHSDSTLNAIWKNYSFCGPATKASLNQVWSTTGPQSGMNCVSILNSALASWGTNIAYCIPAAAPYTLSWRQNGRLGGLACVPFGRSSDAGWTSGNYFLCAGLTDPYGALGYQTYPYAPPQLNSITPAGGPTAGGTVLTLLGANFGFDPSSVSVLVGSQTCVVSFSNFADNSFTCTVPAGENSQAITIQVSSQTSNLDVRYQYDPPLIQSVSPKPAPTAPGNGYPYLTITGINFCALTGAVTVGGATCSVVSWSSTSIVCSQKANGLNQTVRVQNTYQVWNSNSPPFAVNFTGPTIMSVSPVQAQTSGGVTLTLTGANFGGSGTVTVGGNPCPLTGLGFSDFTIQCVLPGGQGINQPIVVTSSNGLSYTNTSFSYYPPIIYSVSPNMGIAGTQVLVSGVNFGLITGGSLKVGTVTADCSAGWQHTSLLCTMPLATGLNIPLQVTVGGILSNNNVTFTYYPTLTGISPANGTTAGGVTITLSGTGFDGTTTVSHGGVARTPVVTSTSLSYSLPAGEGTASVTVTTTSVLSNAMTFRYNKPVITGVTPSNSSTTGGATITLYGMNFGRDNSLSGGATSVTFGPSSATVISCNHTVLVVTNPAGYGTRSITVTVAGQASDPATFTYNAPLLTRLNPATGVSGGGYVVELFGTGLGNGNVFVGALQVVTTFGNGTYARFTMPANGVGAQPVYIVPTSNTASNSLVFQFAAPLVTSVSPSTGPTGGSTILTITGSSFGPAPSVAIGFGVCSVQFSNDTYLRCTTPVGQGTNLSVVVASGPQDSSANFFPFSYAPPSCSTAGPTPGITAGGGLLTITGSSFGTTGTVSVGPYGCDATNPLASWSHNTITCVLPAGQGSGYNVRVTVQSQVSPINPSCTFSYVAPQISSISPALGNTAGATKVIVVGTNFGQAANVSLATYGTCTPSAFPQTNTQFECYMPAGEGTNIAVTVTVGNQNNAAQVPVPRFSYSAPQFTSVSPATIPTSGGVLTLVGSNFGANKSATVNITLSRQSTNTVIASASLLGLASSTAYLFVVPPGTGTGWTISLTVAGQPASFLQGVGLSYTAPYVASITGCVTSGNATVSCNVQTNTPIQISGTNFGTSTAVTSVSVNGNNCPVTGVTQTVVSCTLQAVPAGGFNLAVVVTVDGQQSTSAAGAYLSFAGPTINVMSLQAPPTGVVGTTVASVTIPSAPVNLYLTGTFWSDAGTSSDTVQIKLGLPGTSFASKPFSCVKPSGATGSFITTNTSGFSVISTNCQITPYPVGSGLVFQINTGTQISQESVDYVNVSAPTILPSSIRTTSISAGKSSSARGILNSGDAVWFDVTNCGNLSSLITVRYGNAGVMDKICGSVQLTYDSGKQVLRCSTQLGFGDGYLFQITANNLVGPVGAVIYNYPVVPTVTQVTGCTPSGNTTVNCPTDGSATITIFGTGFGSSPLSATVNGVSCININYMTPQQFSCLLPAGTGALASVAVTFGTLTSQAVNYVSYASARIDSITSTACQLSGINLVNCPRDAIDTATGRTAVLTVTGAFFGPTVPRLVVGGSECQNVTYVQLNQQITCLLPTSTLQSLTVYFFQYGGQVTVASQSLSYYQCPVGYYAADGQLTCQPCGSGTYTDQAGLTACKPCIAGTYSGSTAASCTPCSRGYYAIQVSSTVGASNCTACPEGYYGNALGRFSCIACEAGKFAQGTANLGCTSCMPSQYQSGTGQNGCVTCEAGRFSALSGAPICSSCPLGQASNNPSGATTCDQCQAGFIAATTNAISCTACPVGTYSSTSGQAVCSPCVSGTYSSALNATGCSPCDFGTYSVADPSQNFGPTSCAICTEGSYGPIKGQATCLTCQRGTYSNTKQASFCTTCAPGQYNLAPGSTVCVDCAAGYFSSSSGTVECTSCPAGTYANKTGSTVCSACLAGSFQPDDGMTTCITCDVGTSNGLTGQASCLPCGGGTVAANPGTTACNICLAGTYRGVSDAATGCIQCPQGKYGSANGEEVCLDCPVGYYGNTLGNTSCVACPAGTATARTGQVICGPCDTGYFTQLAGSIVCDKCPVGSFSSTPGSQSCQTCPAGTFQGQEGQPGCTNCLLGTYSYPGQAGCSQCDPGTYSDNATGSCLVCPAGSVQPSSGATTCNVCPPGSYVSASGQQACSPCDPGSFVNASGATVCGICQTGTYQPSSGQQLCQVCPKGTIASVNGLTSCVPCPAGQFVGDIGQSSCGLCSPGRFQGAAGQSACLNCAAGTAIQDEGQFECDACLAGTFAPFDGMQLCESCPRGSAAQPSIGSSIGPTTCTVCDIGRYAITTGSETCTDCRVGSFTNSPGASACTTCTPGAYQSLAAQSQCLRCAAGTFTDVYATVVCQNCKAGFISGSQGMSVCSACQNGTFAATDGASLCAECPTGRYNPSTAQSDCQSCPVGTAVNVTGQSDCVTCPAGTFSATEGAAECINCPAGQYSPQPGAVTCLSCRPGTVSSSEGTTNCTSCAPGQYSQVYGALVCVDCPAGTASASIGSDSCPTCSIGKYSGIHNRSCTDCPVGRAQAKQGQNGCDICAPGYFSPGAAGSCTLCGPSLIQTFAGQGSCLSCPGHAVSDESRISCLCDKGYALRGSTAKSAGSCVVCPQGADCRQAGTQYEQMNTLPGYWEQNMEFYRCLLDTQCVGGPNSPCAPHREGVLCARCESGYTKDIYNDCAPCGGSGKSWTYSVLLGLVFLAALVLQYYIVLRSSDQLFASSLRELEAKRRQQAGYVVDEEDEFQQMQLRHHGELTIYGPPPPAPNFAFKLKIALSFAQIITNMSGNLEIQWPTAFKTFVTFFNIANLDFFQGAAVGCVIHSDFYTKLWIYVSIPIAMGVGLYLFYLLPNYYLTTRMDHDEGLEIRKMIRQKYFRLLVFSMFLIYPSISSTTLRLYICKKVVGVSYLMADFSLTCSGPTYLAASIIDIPFVILYPIGIPVFFFFMLNRYKTRLHETGIRAELGFLYDAYERHLWYFEMCDMAHKLLLTSLLGFLPVSAQMSVALGIIAIYMAVLLVGKPYIRKADDRLHILAQSELLLVVLAGRIFNAGLAPDDAMNTAMSVILITVFILFFVYLILSSITVIIKIAESSPGFNKLVAKIRGKEYNADHAHQTIEKKKKEKAAKKKLKPGEELYDTLSVPSHTKRRDLFTDQKDAILTTVHRNPLATGDQTSYTDANYDEVTGLQLHMKANPMVVSENYMKGGQNGPMGKKEAAARAALGDKPITHAPVVQESRRRGSSVAQKDLQPEPQGKDEGSGSGDRRVSTAPQVLAVPAGPEKQPSILSVRALPSGLSLTVPSALAPAPSIVSLANLQEDDEEEEDIAPKRKGFE